MKFTVMVQCNGDHAHPWYVEADDEYGALQAAEDEYRKVFREKFKVPFRGGLTLWIRKEKENA